jgi:hypothetical protein
VRLKRQTIEKSNRRAVLAGLERKCTEDLH